MENAFRAMDRVKNAPDRPVQGAPIATEMFQFTKARVLPSVLKAPLASKCYKVPNLFITADPAPYRARSAKVSIVVQNVWEVCIYRMANVWSHVKMDITVIEEFASVAMRVVQRVVDL